MLDKLPDLLRPGLKLVFCGSAAGAASAAKGAYYAGPGNRFWPTLHKIGLTPHRLRLEEFALLLEMGIGLTDIAKAVSGQDAEIPIHAFDRVRLTTNIRNARPAHLAFNGKKAAAMFLGLPTGRIPYGRIHKLLPDFPPLTVLPSTSGVASSFWDISHWRVLAGEVLANQQVN